MLDKTKVSKLTAPYWASNGWLTTALFNDSPRYTGSSATGHAPFSLYMSKDGAISAMDTFVAMGDPTGYKWAMKYLKSFEHWEYMVNSCDWFQEWYNKALKHLHTKQRSEALDQIQEIAEHGATENLRMQAAKYIAERPYEQADLNKQKKAGRPSKSAVKGEMKRLANLDKETQDDLKRINLKLVKK